MDTAGQETRYLPTFLAVCEAGGFHRAAQRLFISQAAVSYQMRALEEVLRLKLFERSGRGVILTERGALLRDYCRRAFSDLAALRRHLQSDDAASHATLRIASVSAFGRYELFPRIRDELSDRVVDLRFPTQAEVLRLVAAGLCDAGFIYEERVSSAYASLQVAQEELILVGTSQLLTNRVVSSIERLSALPFVTYDESEYVFGRWFETFFGRQPSAFDVVSRFEELEEVIEFVRLGRGVSIVPDGCVKALLAARKLVVRRPMKGRRCLNTIYRVTRAGASIDPDLTRLTELLGQSARSRTK